MVLCESDSKRYKNNEASEGLWFRTHNDDKGKVTDDDVINVLDILAIVNIILGYFSPTSEGDMDYDGDYDVDDVWRLVGYYLGPRPGEEPGRSILAEGEYDFQDYSLAAITNDRGMVIDARGNDIKGNSDFDEDIREAFHSDLG